MNAPRKDGELQSDIVADATHQRQGMLMRFVSVWVIANLVVWFAPDAYDFCQKQSRLMRRQRAASPYHYGEVGLELPQQDFMPYLMFAPERSGGPLESRPLVLLLHGSGKRGSDGLKHRGWFETFLDAAQGQDGFPCVVVAPQCPVEVSWSSSPGGDVEKAVLRLVDDLTQAYSIDPARIYIVGYSMGGFGAWHLAAEPSHRFAAILPVAGGGNPETASSLEFVSCWAIHGAKDNVVAVSQSERMVEAVSKHGGDARLSRVGGLGHGSWKVVRNEPGKYLQWLFEQRKKSKGHSDQNESL